MPNFSVFATEEQKLDAVVDYNSAYKLIKATLEKTGRIGDLGVSIRTRYIELDSATKIGQPNENDYAGDMDGYIKAWIVYMAMTKMSKEELNDSGLLKKDLWDIEPSEISNINNLYKELNEDFVNKYNEGIESGKTQDEIRDDISEDTTSKVNEKVESDSNEVKETSDNIADTLGGVLLKPITGFLTYIVDVVFDTAQHMLINNEANVLVNKNTNKYFEVANGNSIELSAKGKDTDKLPFVLLSPEEIFSNKLEIFDINFISGTGNGTPDSPVEVLRGIISNWYSAIRTLCIVGLLSVLVYIGIRIIISSSASEKSKYKQMIFDWVIAMCLLFVIHYIMAFTITITNAVTNLISGTETTSLIGKSDDLTKIKDKMGAQSVIVNVNATKEQVKANNEAANEETIDRNIEKEVSLDDGQFTTNMLGYARFMARGDWGDQTLTEQLSWMIIYFALVFYTIRFALVYIKRVIMVAFLTMIAPFVALTYPIDKISDGKAQAFNMWVKEYMFNAILQPFHLLIYYIFVMSAMQLAANNMIYALVVLGFMIPAEKLLKKMFGFDKAPLGTTGGLGSFAGGAVASSLINSMKKSGNKGGNSGGKDNKIRQKNEEELPKDDSIKIGASANTREGKGLDEYDGQDSNEDQQTESNEQNQDQNKVPEWRDDLTQEEIADRDNWQATRNELGESGDKEAIDYANENLDKYRKQDDNIEQQEKPQKQLNLSSVNTQTPIRQMSRGKAFRKALWNGGGRSWKNIKNSAYKNFGTPKNFTRTLGRGAKALGRGYLKAGAAVAIGAAGLAYGLTTGDASKAASYALGAGTAGYSAGGTAARLIGNTVGKGAGKINQAGHWVADETRNQMYGVESARKMREQKQLEQSRNDYKHSKEAIEQAENVRKYYSEGSKTENIIDDLSQMRDYGITESKDMEKLVKARNKLGFDKVSNEEIIEKKLFIDKEGITRKDLRNEKDRVGLEKQYDSYLSGNMSNTARNKEVQKAMDITNVILGGNPGAIGRKTQTKSKTPPKK